MSKKTQKQYYIKPADRDEKKRLAEEYSRLGWILLPRGQYVLVVPSREKKKDKKKRERKDEKTS